MSRTTTNRSLWIVGILALACTVVSADSTTTMAAVDAAIENRELVLAERLLDQIIGSDPRDASALVKRGTLRSWQGRRTEAREDFRRVLRDRPEHLGALVAFGYDMAWGGRYEEAKELFGRSLRVAPQNIGARKGLAFTRLWDGDYGRAVDLFESLLAEDRNDAESAIGLARAHLGLGHQRRAGNAFRAALDAQPGLTEAKEGLLALHDGPALIELNLAGGTTSTGGGSGLRSAEIAGWLGDRWRWWSRYDNTLTLDTPLLARSGVAGDAWLGGVMLDHGGRVLSRIELGRRSVNGEEQTLFLPEVALMARGFLFKGGAIFSRLPDAAGTDRTLYAGVGFPLSAGCRIEPTGYFTRFSNSSAREWRARAFGECALPRGWRLGSGLAVGRQSGAGPGIDGGVFTGDVNLSLPVGAYHRIFFNVRRESHPLRNFTISTVGIQLRLPRK